VLALESAVATESAPDASDALLPQEPNVNAMAAIPISIVFFLMLIFVVTNVILKNEFVVTLILINDKFYFSDFQIISIPPF
jgi:hypothetical protein